MPAARCAIAARPPTWCPRMKSGRTSARASSRSLSPVRRMMTRTLAGVTRTSAAMSMLLAPVRCRCQMAVLRARYGSAFGSRANSSLRAMSGVYRAAMPNGAGGDRCDPRLSSVADPGKRLRGDRRRVGAQTNDVAPCIEAELVVVIDVHVTVSPTRLLITRPWSGTPAAIQIELGAFGRDTHAARRTGTLDRVACCERARGTRREVRLKERRDCGPTINQACSVRALGPRRTSRSGRYRRR
jgi:hypothetical protein